MDLFCLLVCKNMLQESVCLEVKKHNQAQKSLDASLQYYRMIDLF